MAQQGQNQNQGSQQAGSQGQNQGQRQSSPGSSTDNKQAGYDTTKKQADTGSSSPRRSSSDKMDEE